MFGGWSRWTAGGASAGSTIWEIVRSEERYTRMYVQCRARERSPAFCPGRGRQCCTCALLSRFSLPSCSSCQVSTFQHSKLSFALNTKHSFTRDVTGPCVMSSVTFYSSLWRLNTTQTTLDCEPCSQFTSFIFQSSFLLSTFKTLTRLFKAIKVHCTQNASLSNPSNSLLAFK